LAIALLYVLETLFTWQKPEKSMNEVIDEVVMALYVLLSLNQLFLVYIFLRVSDEYRWKKTEL